MNWDCFAAGKKWGGGDGNLGRNQALSHLRNDFLSFGWVGSQDIYNNQMKLG